jgi:hypothetical protein
MWKTGDIFSYNEKFFTVVQIGPSKLIFVDLNTMNRWNDVILNHRAYGLTNDHIKYLASSEYGPVVLTYIGTIGPNLGIQTQPTDESIGTKIIVPANFELDSEQEKIEDDKKNDEEVTVYTLHLRR